MFDAEIENIVNNRITKYVLKRHDTPLSVLDVHDLWQDDADFRTFYTRLLADSPFAALIPLVESFHTVNIITTYNALAASAQSKK